jgi:hypothetical protein
MPSAAVANRIDTDAEVYLRSVRPGQSVASEPSEPGTPAWYYPTIRAVNQLLLLEGNWNTRGARPIESDSAERAIDLLSRCASVDTPAPDVVPTVRGGLQLEWHRCRMDIELEIAPSTVCLYWRERDTGREWEGELATRRQLMEALAEMTERHHRTRLHGVR